MERQPLLADQAWLRRLHLERLPAYAPNHNLDEGVWNLLNRRELRNRCCDSVDELRRELTLAIRRLQRKRHLLTACLRRCGYAVEDAR